MKSGSTGAPLPSPGAEELASWMGEGERVESIDDETTFVDPGMRTPHAPSERPARHT